jgi:WD40 repeat protein
LCSGTSDGKVVRWDVETGKVLEQMDLRPIVGMRSIMRNFGDSVTSGSLSGDGDKAIVVFGGCNLIVLNFGQGYSFHLLRENLDDISSVRMSIDGRTALSGSFGGELILWDIDRGFPLSRLRIDGNISSLAMRGNQVIVGDSRR